MHIICTIDRIESDLAVLEFPDGRTLPFPRDYLPPGCGEGDKVQFQIECS